ncbi:DNA methyltransferase [Sphingomonas sp. CD22]|uniref:site-specific DNA-methyltransferase n=1 Tax=Sphingomonas sp. CD22 TaxID=3100214 RepID=UPI002AE031B3|nr:DNA methyltransferase [Sphingomonas sp. CD22]MEA1085214.1 DNA methyltransferase [Sphingomonas sp. CD22]
MSQPNTRARSADSKMLFARLGPVTYRRPADLVAYKRNARKHPERQLVALEASIRQFGFNAPVLIAVDGEIIAGHARVEAAKRVGLDEIPTISADHLSPAQVKAYRLADNRLPELATWDMDALIVELEEIIALDEIQVESMGWSSAEMDSLFSQAEPDAKAATDPADQQPNPPVNAVAKPGDLWLLGRHRLLCGSALESSSWDRLLNGQIATMIFTDPPYNVPITGHVSGLGKVQHAEFAQASGEMSRDEFTAFLTQFLAAMLPHVVDGGVVDLCMDWRHLRELLAAIDTNALSLLNLCCWNKTNGGMGSLYRSKHELIAIAKKGRAPHINNVELGKHGRYRTNVWDYAGVNSFGASRMQDLADHPTVKPIALVADAIRDVTHQGDIVLDAFMGSGTTLLAAERTGRVGYGTEIEPRYIDVAIERWQQMTGKAATLDGDGRTWTEVAAERLLRNDAQADEAGLDQEEVDHVTA